MIKLCCILTLVICFMIQGCSDANLSSIESYGNQGHITCYSGTIVILDTTSTGRIATVDKSDGWEFRDSQDNKYVRVSGACVIRN